MDGGDPILDGRFAQSRSSFVSIHIAATFLLPPQAASGREGWILLLLITNARTAASAVWSINGVIEEPSHAAPRRALGQESEAKVMMREEDQYG